jgi:aminopeptidase N
MMQAKRRQDYQPCAFSIDSVELCFELSKANTRVTSKLLVTRNDDSATKISLDGEDIVLQSLYIDGRKAEENTDYTVSDSALEINITGESTVLEIENTLSPEANTSLEGLYYVSNAFCTQCEAEGFRKITYFLDRPDVLSVYTVTIISDDENLKQLLSNGNKTDDFVMPDGRRKVVWHDPHYKPCYLFALVAGDFDCLEDTFITSEGRSVALQVYVDKGRLHQAHHAMASLKRAMKWDEDTYGLAYDLDIYMIVAVDFFNMGAMENKGLNVFNSKFVLAEPSTATDDDYFNIESIIAHEYFHNWTGNRVTCRDWFQLSLKEGLTVFRDQRFSADMSSELGTRISQVKVMREHQFAEDAGPMSHPIRPDEVVEMNNFYTVTVYDKGAEVIRMMHTLLGVDGFRKGMDLYFERHDGQAVTCDDFVQAMQDANNVDLTHFKRWYSQSGTPQIKVIASEIGELIVSQYNAPTADQQVKEDLFIPFNISVIDESGQEHLLSGTNDGTLILDAEQKCVPLPDKTQRYVPVLLADFSAPVTVKYNYSKDDLIHIIRFAQSHYAKWDASQKLYAMLIGEIYANQGGMSLALEHTIAPLFDELLTYIASSNLPDDVVAQLLTLPSFETLGVEYQNLLPLTLDASRDSVHKALAKSAHTWALKTLKRESNQAYAYEQGQVHWRSLKSVCCKLIAIASANVGEGAISFTDIYVSSDNMTDKLAAIKAVQQTDADVFDALMQRFEGQYGHDPVVMDKWFALQASAVRTDILSRLDLLKAHGTFSIKNPNKVRAVMGTFAFYNTAGFHAADGSGYRYVVDYLMELDALNPQVAARIVTPMLQLQRYAAGHQELIKSQLTRLFNTKGLSRDLFEKLSKTLSKA